MRTPMRNYNEPDSAQVIGTITSVCVRRLSRACISVVYLVLVHEPSGLQRHELRRTLRDFWIIEMCRK